MRRFNEGEDEIWVWDVSTWQPTLKIGQDGTIWDVDFSPDSQWLLAAFVKGKYPDTLYHREYEGQLWDVKSGAMVARMPHPHAALDVMFSHHGQWIAVSGAQEVRIWELRVEDHPPQSPESE